MGRDDPQIKLRLNAELKARIQESADTENRSMNAEIVSRLEGSFNDSGQEISRHFDRLDKRLAGIEKRLDALESVKPKRK